MSKLITIVGTSGVGKTALVQALGKAHSPVLSSVEGFATAYEQHAERPFQALFKQDKKYALANQLDYLLLRAEQEKELRALLQIGLMDGGLDLDFHGFTRLFLRRGLLTEPEYDLCRRVYTLIRESLPEPELIVRLCADEITVADRLAKRNRINIASAEDTALFNSYVEEWLASVPSHKKLELDVTNESPDYSRSVAMILQRVVNW